MVKSTSLNQWHRSEFNKTVKEWDFYSPSGRVNLLVVDHKRQPHLLKSIKGKRYVAKLEVVGKKGQKHEYYGFRSQRSTSYGVKVIKRIIVPRMLRRLN